MRNRFASWLGGSAGALAACVIARAARPFWPIPRGGVGFVTVHAVPKGIDTLRFVLLLVLVPAGAIAAARRSAAARPADEDTPAPSHPGWALTVGVVVIVAVLRVLLSDGIHGPIDYFHAGHFLSPASDVLAGERFFRDVLPFHGLAADGGLDVLAFDVGGKTLATARRLRTILDVGFFAAAAALFAVVLRGRARILAGTAFLLLLTGALRLSTAFPFFRTLPLLATASAVALFVRTRRRAALVAAGAVAAAGLFWSLDTGVFACAGLLAWLAADVVAFPAPESGPRSWALVLTGMGAVLIPAVIGLAAFGALVPFVRDSATVLASTGAAWDLPAPVPSDVLRAAAHGPVALLTSEALRFYAPILFFGGVATMILLRRRDGRLGERDRVLLALLVFSIVGFRTALGRSSYSHTRFSMVVPALLLAAWLPEAVFRPRRWRPAGAAAGVVLGAAALLYAETRESIRDAAKRIASAPARRVGAGYSPLDLQIGGGARVPAEQAAALAAFRRYCDASLPPGETFYDFADAGALYFLADRRNPVGIYEASILSADRWQERAIARLERSPPAFVVVAAGQSEEAFDGISIAARCPRLAAWIAERYPETVTVGTFTIRRRAGD